MRDKKEKILNLIKAWGTIKHSYGSKDAEGLMALLDQEGVVIKVGEIKEIPRAAADPEAYIADKVGVSWERSAGTFRAFKDAGYVAVERLI